MNTIDFSSYFYHLRRYLANHTIPHNGTDFPTFIIDEVASPKPPLNPKFCGVTSGKIAEIYAKFYHPTISISICVFGILSNALNVVVLRQKQMISAPINRILTCLAAAEMCVMMEYIPYVYYHYLVVPEHMDFPFSGAIYILFHGHFTQILHTTSICLTLMLAVWRFLALKYPQKQQVWCTHFRCTVGLTLSFLLPIVLCFPTYFVITITPQKIIENSSIFTLYHTDLSETFRSDSTALAMNFWIYSVFIKLLPCCILTFITLWLIHTLILAKKRRKNLHIAGATNERKADRTTKMLVAILLLFLVTEFPQGIFAFMIGLKGKNLFLKCYQVYGEVMDVFALFSGAVNFILYCVMNRMFRKTFGGLFKKKVLNWGLVLSDRMRMPLHVEMGVKETEN